jgi:hypothetical protein
MGYFHGGSLLPEGKGMFFNRYKLRAMGIHDGKRKIYSSPKTPMKFLSFDPNDESVLRTFDV